MTTTRNGRHNTKATRWTVDRYRTVKQSRNKLNGASISVGGRYIAAFLDYVRTECHLAQNTVAAYRRDMRRFETIGLNGGIVVQLTIQELADYVGWLQRTRARARQRRSAPRVAERSSFRYLQLEGVLRDNLAELLGSQKLWQRVPKVLSPETVDRLLTAPRPRDKLWRRDRALLELLYATGCRASEVSSLRLSDMHLDRRAIAAAGGKGTRSGWCRLVRIGDRRRARHICGMSAVKSSSRNPTAASLAACSTARGLRLRRERIWELVKRYARTRSRTCQHQPAHAATQLRHAHACRGAPTFGRCKKCSATPASPRRRFTPTSITRG